MFCPNCGREVEAAEKFCTQCGAPIDVAAPVKKSGPSRSPKIVGIVGGVVAVVVIIALLIGGIGGTSGPEQTIRSFYRAAERLDANGQAALLAREEYRAMWAMTLQMSYDMIDSLSISDLLIIITSQIDDTAEAIAEYDFTYVVKDGTVYPEEHEEDYFELVRVGNNWLIDETDFFYGDWS
jgi:hypothetical protein